MTPNAASPTSAAPASTRITPASEISSATPAIPAAIERSSNRFGSSITVPLARSSRHRSSGVREAVAGDGPPLPGRWSAMVILVGRGRVLGCERECGP